MEDFIIYNISGIEITVSFNNQQVQVNGVHTSPEPVYQIATGQPITVSFANAAINPIVVNAPAGNGQITLLVQPSPAGDNPEVRFQMF